MDFQTVDEFLAAPFGEKEEKSNEFEKKYKDLIRRKRIVTSGNTIVEDNYFLHIKIGSETNENQFYDVVIMFFTDNENVKGQMSLQNYYIKFFSNSPSFIYQYATLYKENGFLIEMLHEKLDPAYADKKPEKRNSSMKLSYDKSIYAALRYMQDYRAFVLNKRALYLQKKKSPEAFFQGIKDFADVKFTQELNSLDKKIDKELKTQKEKKKEEKGKRKKEPSKGRIVAKTAVGRNPDSKSGVIKTKRTSRVSPKKYTGRVKASYSTKRSK